MRSLFDVNLLIALFEPDHIHHERAHRWWKQHQSEGWASCPLTQNGFARVLSQPSYPRPLTTAAALRLFAEQTARTDHRFWPDDVSLVDVKRFDHAQVLGPKQVTDIYLLALAVKHGGALVTFDTGISLRAVRGAKKEHVVVI